MSQKLFSTITCRTGSLVGLTVELGYTVTLSLHKIDHEENRDEGNVLSLQTSELGVTEHVEGDPCKFALWVGRTPTSDNKIVLKVKTKIFTSHFLRLDHYSFKDETLKICHKVIIICIFISSNLFEDDQLVKIET